MKKLLLIPFAMLMLLCIGCDDLTTNIDTNLVANMSVDIQKPQLALKTAGYYFTVSDTIDLKDNKDLEGYLESIKEVDIKSIKCKLRGIHTGEAISELNIELLETGLSTTLYNISDNDVEQLLNVAQELLKSASDYIMREKRLVIRVSGTSTYAPMTLYITLDHEVVITASVLD
ncbi:MAG: hypothetical protein JW717_09365 [Marinilabiliaceae bacterium]|nr:hypothetical protein [Marinilabiliaceae bacterium]